MMIRRVMVLEMRLMWVPGFGIDIGFDIERGTRGIALMGEI